MDEGIGRRVNFVYEFKTPNGYLPVGFDHRQVGVIFDVLNNKEWEEGIYAQRLGYDGKFKILEQSASAFDILNLDNEGVKNKAIWELTKDEVFNDFNIFVIDSMHNEPIVNYVREVNFKNIFTEKSLELIRNHRNFKILIIDNKEGAYPHGKDFFQSLKDFYDFLEINNDEQLFYITNSSDVRQKYSTFLFHTKSESFMKVKNIEFLIYDAGEPIDSYFQMTNGKSLDVVYEQNVDYSLPIESELGHKRKKYFLSLNRNSGRLHRPRMVLELIKRNLFEKGLVSLLQTKEFDEWAEREGNEEYKTLIKDKYPFVVDYEDERFVSGMHNFFTKKDMWQETYFSLVSETSSSDDWIFITEKIIRPIIYFHPFILWGNPGTLEVLRSYGFETFPEFFDEDYDNIYNEDKRLKAVIDNVNRLCDKSLDEIHLMYMSVLDKLIHNRMVLTKLFYEKTRNKTILSFLTNNENKPII